ncbi:MAG: 50S ribosomal protein L9 [Candidatus Omnitrophica bacterium]|nr:50S ribosomal protein L9 [Candidatus Omnitrophota bacterium]MBU2043971.1 50S ribosomal protein L9 [Candidatus Omnitrophota bacterium]MBU2250793.1 50S ribosomal protein L9 [Candidatus Omnitrophota bacterium]MBU2266102.1 50S ribosomal protein L9 [Candidatus Omnitrophota bacterium]MBU2473422.1 50S ribosomal protein L9 [Candidatus Omnitrophota bacterium]
MKVILLADLGKLGQEGQTKEVKDGYARNYLIPRGLALLANAGSLKKFEDLKKVREKNSEIQKQKFLKVKEQIEKISLTVTAEAKDDEELYGAISESQIEKLLEAEGISFQKGSILVPEPMRKLGVYDLKISLCPEVEAKLRVWVVKK